MDSIIFWGIGGVILIGAVWLGYSKGGKIADAVSTAKANVKQAETAVKSAESDIKKI